VIDLPMLAVLSGLIRMLELRLIEVGPVELLSIEMPYEVRESVETEGLEIVALLDVDPPGLLPEDTMPEPRGVERLTDTLPEPLRLGIDRLEETETERLGADPLTDILPVLPRLGADLLEVTVPDRLGIGALLVVVLLEMFRLGVGRLRLADIELDRLGAGARLGVGALLADGALRVGAGARLGAGALVGAVAWLELLPELELFRELLAIRAESATKTRSKMHTINRKPHIFASLS